MPPLPKRPTVVAVGECTRDRYSGLGVDRPGGISLNFAVQARTAGADAAIVGVVGDDQAGRTARMALERYGVDTTHLHQTTGATATQVIELGEGGERRFPPGGYDPGVLAGFALSAADRAFIARFHVVAAPCFSQLDSLFHEAMAAAGPDALLVADGLDGAELTLSALRRPLGLLFVSGPELLLDQLAPWAEQANTGLVVTHGALGSSALVRGRRYRQPAVPVPLAERRDSTGCGDAFQATFTVAYAAGADIETALRLGAVRAASVIRHVGAVGGVPFPP